MADPLSVVCWRWGQRYSVDYVNRLASMLSRHLHLAHRLFCITDDPGDLNSAVVPIPIWPANSLGRARRLRIFDPSMRSLFGPRILQLDIDAVITDDITPLVDRREALVAWRNPPDQRYLGSEKRLKENPVDGVAGFNTSILLMDTGVLPVIWRDYCATPEDLEAQARKRGFWSSLYRYSPGRPSKKARLEPLPAGDDDQAIFSLYAMPLGPPFWTEDDGVYKVGRRGFSDRGQLPENARICFFNGSIGSNAVDGKKSVDLPWIKEHWR